MPYYTHHNYNDVYQYVCVDALSDCADECKPYYTFHMNMDAQLYLNHRNTCIHHCVREFVHLKYPAKKTKVKH